MSLVMELLAEWRVNSSCGGRMVRGCKSVKLITSREAGVDCADGTGDTAVSIAGATLSRHTYSTEDVPQQAIRRFLSPMQSTAGPLQSRGDQPSPLSPHSVHFDVWSFNLEARRTWYLM